MVIKDLIRKILDGSVNVNLYEYTKNYIFFSLTDDMVYDEKTNTYGSDITPPNCFICEGKSDTYYILGKINREDREEIHIYYQQGIEFNAMLLEYVIGGEYEDNEDLLNLYNLLRKSTSK